MYGQHMAHIRLLICCVLAVSSFSSNGLMQHMFSSIPHITPAIEVYLISDTSYYRTLYMHKGPLALQVTYFGIPIKTKKLTVNLLLTWRCKRIHLLSIFFGAIEHIN